MHTDPTELIERLRYLGKEGVAAGVVTIWGQAANMIEDQSFEIARARQEGFAAGVEAAAKVAEEGREYWRVKCDDTKNRRESRDYETMAIACVHIEHAIRATKPA